MKKKKKTKTKLKEKAFTLEDIFNQVALLPPSVSRSDIVLTPLSSEACLATGINPDALQRREFETFGRNSSDLDIQRLKYEAYEKRRHELMMTASKEKVRLGKTKKIVGGNDDQSVTCSETNSQSNGPSGAVLQQEKVNITLMEIEEKRLQKSRDKQKRELLQLLQFEQKMEKIQRDVHLKAEKDAVAEERKKAKMKKQERRQAEERRVRELRRKAQEDAEEEIHRISARVRSEKERQIKKEREQQEMETKKRQRQIDEEREKKKELQRIKIEKQQLKKLHDMQKKFEDRKIKERERQMKIDAKRAMDQYELDLKRKEAAKRIALNKEAKQRHEEERKKIVVDKMIQNQQQQEHIAALREREHILNKKEKETMARKREYQTQSTKQREMEKKEFMMQKFQEDERKVALMQSMREQEMSIMKQEKELDLLMKHENVQRIKRMQEYKRIETMKKISENHERTDELLKKKEEMAKNRQKNAVEAKLRKDQLLQILEKSKSSGGKAIKKILAQLENNEISVGTSKKKTSGPPDINTSKSTKRLPTKTANETKHPPIIEIGPPPEAPSLVARISGAPPQKEYISPYASTRNK